jgi:hypothetical protein
MKESEMKLFLTALTTVACFGLGMYYHDFRINRKYEILFLCLALAGALTFEYFLHNR